MSDAFESELSRALDDIAGTAGTSTKETDAMNAIRSRISTRRTRRRVLQVAGGLGLVALFASGAAAMSGNLGEPSTAPVAVAPPATAEPVPEPSPETAADDRDVRADDELAARREAAAAAAAQAQAMSESVTESDSPATGAQGQAPEPAPEPAPDPAAQQSAPEPAPDSRSEPEAADSDALVSYAAEQMTFLFVGNESFRHPDVHLTVMVDGEPVTDTNYSVDDQHSWIPLALPFEPGTHTIEVLSDTGASYAGEFTFPDTGDLYAVVQYWFSGADESPIIGFDTSTEPIYYS